MAKEWTQLLVIPLPKKSNLKQCLNYRTISPISYLCTIMLRGIFDRLDAKAEELKNKQFLNTVEQIFSNRVIIEKHLQQQRGLLHNFIDFNKATDSVWRAGIWQVIRNFKSEKGLVQAI